MVVEAVVSFLKDGVIGQFYKHGLAQRRKKPYHKNDRSFGAFGIRGRTVLASVVLSLFVILKDYLAGVRKARAGKKMCRPQRHSK
jgi:hypothetical protein